MTVSRGEHSALSRIISDTPRERKESESTNHDAFRADGWQVGQEVERCDLLLHLRDGIETLNELAGIIAATSIHHTVDLGSEKIIQNSIKRERSEEEDTSASFVSSKIAASFCNKGASFSEGVMKEEIMPMTGLIADSLESPNSCKISSVQ